ncbi:hypothetical protein [Acinetobacter radioresistens]|uniref:hypothetical protein n=1 Tax=Acinetobacter radioresistens TaxID=40216 RepID=UPI001D18FFB6|nr:hypothetical protein [Acinetobacter radioresistens]
MTTYQQFTLNAESAKQADAGGRIEQTGKYIGIIKSMEFTTAKSGAQGFEINFESDSKEYATISIWTISKDGQPLSGTHKVNALLACCGVRALTPTDQKLEKYDFDTKQKVMRLCTVAPEMTNKRVGLLLQRENYLNTQGQQRHQMNLFASFSADSELMAKEVLDRKTTPELLPKALDRLLAIGDSNRQPSSNQSGGYAQPQTNYQSSNSYPSNNSYQSSPAQHADLDDDLPF